MGPKASVLIYYKLQRFSRDKRSRTIYRRISYKEKVLKIQPLEPNSQHFIFFVTYEWAQYARVYVPGKVLQPNVL